MITFSVGLVLREGDRTFEFERQIDSTKVQFKYLDNYEIRTFSIAKLYARILEKSIIPVHQNGHAIQLPGKLAFKEQDYSYPLTLVAEQEARLEYRLKYVKGALTMRVSPGSLGQCRDAIQKIAAKMLDASPPSASTLHNWLKRYLGAGSNPFALLDLRPLVKRPKRIGQQTETMIDAAVAKHYMQRRGLSVAETYRRLIAGIRAKIRAEDCEVPTPSLRTVQRRVNEIDPYMRDYKRYGPGYAKNKWRYSLKGDQSTRILERVEVDHTWLDLWVLDPRSGVPIGRPWITVVIDRFSGYIMGLYISFYGPSVATVAHAIKNSILPKDELMLALPEIAVPWTSMGVAETYVLDNGLEFHANAFKRLMWELRADLLYNPVRQPWLKASVERTMLEVNRILPTRGKVYKPTANMQPVDPRLSAAILFDDLCTGLTMWAADRFPRSIHPKTLVRPLDLWEEGRASSPLPMFPIGFEQFEITAGVSTTRTVDGDGIFFKYLRYNSVELQDYLRSEGRKVRTEIRFNPDDLERLHVLLPKSGQWLPVELQRPSIEYGRGLSLIQHEIIRKEASKALTRSNAVEELQAASIRLQDYWGSAIKRGVKVRRDSDLIRLQGLTSANIHKSEASTPQKFTTVPDTSFETEKLLPNVMPFRAFSLDEDYV